LFYTGKLAIVKYSNNLVTELASDKHYIYFKIDLKMFCEKKSGFNLRVTGSRNIPPFTTRYLKSEYHASDLLGAWRPRKWLTLEIFIV
jgi:hypothetical protein